MRFKNFFENLQYDLKTFLYWCLVLTCFRIVFIIIFIGQLDGNYDELLKALFIGSRLSLKTAGLISLIGFIFTTLPMIFISSKIFEKIKFCWHEIVLLIFSILFMAKIPYYKIFNANFNMMIFNGLKDDTYAIVLTAITEYQAWWRLPLAIFLAIILIKGLKYIYLQTPNINFEKIKYKRTVIISTFIFLPIFFVFIRFGGSFTYANSINWESAARLKSNLLNEAILDEGQALYRVYSSKKLLDKVNNIDITREQLNLKIGIIGGNTEVNDIEEAFLRTNKETRLKQQPSNIVLIIGESFGQWPFLPKYQNLGIVKNMQNLIKEDNVAAIKTMLPHGSGTIAAVNGIITGLPSAGLYANYQPMSFKSEYKTGLGYMMHELGYKTIFWYGGFSGWQNIRKFVLAQNFDEFHCADEFVYNGGNAWGCPDAILFKYVEDYIKNRPNDKVCHVILTTSNHPPYTIPVYDLGFPKNDIIEHLPKDISSDAKTINELGHIWYADKTMGEFINNIKNMDENTFFVITGDHSERFNFVIEQDIRTLSSIPCIFYGKNINKDWFKNNSIGCHMQISSTIVELIAPKGYKYSSLMPSMLDDNDFVFNYRLCADKDNIYELKQDNKKILYANEMRSIAAWRILKGNKI